jgi:hypothetical protein
MYKLLGLLVSACVLVLSLAPPAIAIDPRYTRFNGCPDRPEILSCIRADTPAGSIRMGNTTVPITQIVTLSGGVLEPVAGDNPLFYNSRGGLTGNPLEVPGGLAGLTGISEFLLNLITFGANRVFAQAVLVGQPRLNFANLDLKLPIRVNLLNPFLRPGCGIGSATTPINLSLTTGTTAPPPPARPISGHSALGAGPDPTTPSVLLLRDVMHVDNSFAVPAASGCDLLGLGLISGLINSRVGLPAAAGNNEAIFDRTDVRLVDKAIVYP